ncbi:DNA polymerase delta subunit 3 [Mortierella sp. AD031]|nr:DNA polymerase delta subunit 3 [Mortierella sp. AD031]
MEHQAMELLTTRVEDEKQNVTYKWLSRSLGISVNTAKELMQSYLTTVGKGKAHGTYYLARQDPETGNQLLSLVSQEDVNAAKKDASVIGCHIYSLEPSPLKDLAILSAINSEATQLQKGKDVNLYRVVRNHDVVITKPNSRPTSTATTSAAMKPTLTTAQSAPGLSGTKPGLKPATSAPAVASPASSTSSSAAAASTTKYAAAPAKGSMMSFFGKAAAKAASAPVPAPAKPAPPAKVSSTLNFKPAVQQKRKADVMTGAAVNDMASPRATRSNEESEEDEIDSEEERDRRLALSSRLDQDQGEVVESKNNKSSGKQQSASAAAAVDLESIKKRQRSARLLAIDDDDDLDTETVRAVVGGRGDDEDDDDEVSVAVMSKEARAALNKEKEAQRLALENMMLMDDTTTSAAMLEDEDSAMIDVEALDPVAPPPASTVTETTNDSGTTTRRRRGVRAVTKRKTSRNERGYMVTEDIVVMEPFSEDEIIEAPTPALVRSEKPASESTKGKTETGGAMKKAGGNQSLLNFFTKK